MDAKLIVTKAATAPEEHPVRTDDVTIGRSPANEIVLPDPERKISSRHARLERRGSAYYLRDLSSKNGTLLRDRRLPPDVPVELKSGDCFSIEEYRLELVFQDDEGEETRRVEDPSRLAEGLTEELRASWAHHLSEPAEVRREALEQVLRARVGEHSPDLARAVCAEVLARLETAPPGRPGAPDETSGTATREALYRSGYQALQELSGRLLGARRFGTPEEVAQFGTLIGNALETTFDWLSRCLEGRREFEGQFSADLTHIFSKEENPLKAAKSPRETGRFLVDWRSPQPVDARRTALEEAFQDLTAHQLGLLAGVQRCLGAALERLSPEFIENQVREWAAGAFLARFRLSLAILAWKQYAVNHREMFEENSKLFNELIFPNIRKGYLAAHAEAAGQVHTTKDETKE